MNLTTILSFILLSCAAFASDDTQIIEEASSPVNSNMSDLSDTNNVVNEEETTSEEKTTNSDNPQTEKKASKKDKKSKKKEGFR